MVELNARHHRGRRPCGTPQRGTPEGRVNCLDVNTEAKKQRVVTLKIKIKPDESRCFGEVSVETSSPLCPAAPIATSIFMSTDLKTGEVSASEVSSGENPMQEILPGVSGSMSGKITHFTDGKSASAGK